MYIPSQEKLVASGDVKFDEIRESDQESSFSVTEASFPSDIKPPEQSVSLDGASDEEFMAAAMRNIADFLLGLQLEHTR